MTRWTEADPAPEQPWRETSQPGIRRLALQACEAAVRAAAARQPSARTQDAATGDTREPAQEPRGGTNSRRADTAPSDTGRDVQRAMGGAA